jgi:hypothetical protein
MVAILSVRSALRYTSDIPMARSPMLETVGPCLPRVAFGDSAFHCDVPFVMQEISHSIVHLRNGPVTGRMCRASLPDGITSSPPPPPIPLAWFPLLSSARRAPRRNSLSPPGKAGECGRP